MASKVARRALLTLVGVVVVLAGCASDDTGLLAEDPQVEPTNAPVIDAASPLEEALGFTSDPARRQFQLITKQRQADESIQQCMDEAGFFYATVPAEVILRSGAFVGDGSREWTTQHGFGITSSFRDALATNTDDGSADAEQQNRQYVSSLTDAQAAAYDRALVGDLTAPSADQGYEPAGCWGASFNEIVRLLGVIDAFEPELDSLNDRLLIDPRMVGFQRTWSACMERSGHRYDSETDLVDAVYARLLAVEVVETGARQQVADPAALDALGQFEVEVAVNSFDCRQDFVANQDRVRDDYENEFLNVNRFRIADLVQAASPG